MTEAEAMNRKCCFAYNTNNMEFDFCLTSRCMAWQKKTNEEGTCLMLFNDYENVDSDRQQKGNSAMQCAP